MPLIFLRDAIAHAFRVLPDFPYKERIAVRLAKGLTNFRRDEDCIVNITMRDGSRMCIDLRSWTELWSFWTGTYDADLILSVSRCLVPGDVVLDIGANVGFYASSLGRRLHQTKGKLYAMEPIPSNFARLKQIIALNGLEDTVQAFNIALGEEEGVVELALEDTNVVFPGTASTGNASIVRDDSDASTLSAQMMRLDDFARQEDITSCRLIKMDVEGAEFMVLKGGESFIRHHLPLILIEFNRVAMEKFGWRFQDVQEIVVPWGYQMCRHEGGTIFCEATAPVADLENWLLVPQHTAKQVLAHINTPPQKSRS